VPRTENLKENGRFQIAARSLEDTVRQGKESNRNSTHLKERPNVQRPGTPDGRPNGRSEGPNAARAEQYFL
jgi:hypothetical protein